MRGMEKSDNQSPTEKLLFNCDEIAPPFRAGILGNLADVRKQELPEDPELYELTGS